MGKSLAKNSIIYSLKTVINMLFPLVTFPYVTRVLSVESLGRINFASSIISYFTLLAGLGIYTFAVKQGAAIRENRMKMNQFASEIFTLNLVSTIASYVIFIFLLVINTKWQQYKFELLIISMVIPLTTLGMDWVYTVYEEYYYVTVRNIICQLISVLFLLIFVREDSDIYWYAFYTVLVNVGSNVINILRVKRYVSLKILFSKRQIHYLKPVLLLFASTVATQIYLNSDVVMLGYMKTDRDVGLYNVAVKIYMIVKNVMMSVGMVSIPRLAFLFKQDRGEYHQLFRRINDIILFLSIPAGIGLFIISNDLVVLFAGQEYFEAGGMLSILSIALPIAVISNILVSGCLLLFGEEFKICCATFIGAFVNLALNMLFIPFWGANVAAITTLFAELMTMLIHLYNIRRLGCHICNIKDMFKTILAAILMLIVCGFVMNYIHDGTLRIFCTICVGVCVYLVFGVVLKNENLVGLKNFIKRRG